MNTKKIFKWIFRISLLSFFLFINFAVVETIPVIIMLLGFYCFYLRDKISYLSKETQTNVNLIEENQKDIKIISEDHATVIKSFKDFRRNVVEFLKKEHKNVKFTDKEN